MKVSLFFFSGRSAEGDTDPYRLLLDATTFADRHGFDSVWVPERHFEQFGGLYPNPSLLGAAIAARTERIQIRAGSVVLPLHHVVRVAEEWAVVDNLSGGRIGISLAPGWHPNDFVLRPEAFRSAKADLPAAVEQLRALWRGDPVELEAGDGRRIPVRTLPRPQRRELPLWLTTAGSGDTLARAGELGTNLLAAMFARHQTMDELRRRVATYRQSLVDAGRDPAAFTVTVAMHTFVGRSDDEVRECVREPISEYLLTFIDQSARFMGSLGSARADDLRSMVDRAFDRYFDKAALLGSPEKCVALIEALAGAGVDEVACLIDFGVGVEQTMASLELLDEVRTAVSRSPSAAPQPRAR